HVAAQHQVVEHGHALEQGDVLEGAREAERRDAARREGRDVLALDDDPARVGVVEAADHVEHGRLAGAVGPDHREDLALLDIEAHLRHGLDAAERLRDLADLDERAHMPGGGYAPLPDPPPRTGCGGKAAARTRFRPSQDVPGLNVPRRVTIFIATPSAGFAGATLLGEVSEGAVEAPSEFMTATACAGGNASRRDSSSAARRRRARGRTP